MEFPIKFFRAFFSESDLSDNQRRFFRWSLLINKIWNGNFPEEWNSASIISIPKKGDLSD